MSWNSTPRSKESSFSSFGRLFPFRSKSNSWLILLAVQNNFIELILNLYCELTLGEGMPMIFTSAAAPNHQAWGEGMGGGGQCIDRALDCGLYGALLWRSIRLGSIPLDIRVVFLGEGGGGGGWGGGGSHLKVCDADRLSFMGVNHGLWFRTKCHYSSG